MLSQMNESMPEHQLNPHTRTPVCGNSSACIRRAVREEPRAHRRQEIHDDPSSGQHIAYFSI